MMGVVLGMARGKMAGTNNPSMNRRAKLLLMAGLAALTLAAYYRALECGFLSVDDPIYVTKNPHWRDALTLRGARWAFTTTRSANWHPLTWLSHQLDYAAYGQDPRGHHLTSVLLHTLNAAILFIALAAMTGAPWRSAFVAALFAVHPLHVESVAWVAERKDVLSTLFWMLTMAAYARYVREQSIGRYALVFVALALGLTAKPMLVSLPLVLLMTDFWPLNRTSVSGYDSDARKKTKRNSRRPKRMLDRAPLRGVQPFIALVMEKLPLFALALASCVVTFVVQRAGGAMGSTAEYPLRVRAANALVCYIGYIGKTIWPARLSIFYPHPGDTLPLHVVVLSGVVLGAVTWAAFKARTGPRYVTVGWFWYVITLVPVIGLVQVGRQAMADRYTYVPLIGLFVIAAWGVPDLVARAISSARVKTAVLAAAASAVIGTCAAATWSNLAYWRGPVEVFQHALHSTNGSYAVRYLLADALVETGRPSEAVRELDRVIKANPRFAPAYVALGTIRFKQGKPEQAMRLYHKALDVEPNLHSAHTALGFALLSRGRIDEAAAHFGKAIAYAPTSAQAHYGLAAASYSKGDPAAAIDHYKAALRLDPDLAEAHYGLGVALARQGSVNEAIAELQEALRLKPNLAEAHVALASIFHRTGDYTAARRELRRAVELGYKPDPALARTLMGSPSGSR